MLKTLSQKVFKGYPSYLEVCENTDRKRKMTPTEKAIQNLTATELIEISEGELEELNKQFKEEVRRGYR